MNTIHVLFVKPIDKKTIHFDDIDTTQPEVPQSWSLTHEFSSEKEDLLGQAYAFRGFLYFQLSLEFQHTYTYDKSLPAPPIYTDITTEGKPMSTQEEMYKLILDDLNMAVTISSSSRIHSG